MQVNLNKNARARLWDSAELPHLGGSPVVEHVLRSDGGTRPAKSIAIEVVVPRGGTASYGLLGVTFECTQTASLAMSVLSSDGRVFAEALALPPERAMFGLPTEYVNSVLSGFLGGAASLDDIPGGSLVFDRAAHGMVGSSGKLFRDLAACVTRVALGETMPWDEVVREELGL
jgi:hypothetical protein